MSLGPQGAFVTVTTVHQREEVCGALLVQAGVTRLLQQILCVCVKLLPVTVASLWYLR